jgi:hypothetical protein
MDSVTSVPITAEELKYIVKNEVLGYEAMSDLDTVYAVLDDENQKYAVMIIPAKQQERPAWAFVLARVVGDIVVIDEDGPIDKPLHQALMKNAGIPREKIVLAYKNEPIPPQGH